MAICLVHGKNYLPACPPKEDQDQDLQGVADAGGLLVGLKTSSLLKAYGSQ